MTEPGDILKKLDHLAQQPQALDTETEEFDDDDSYDRLEVAEDEDDDFDTRSSL